MYLVDSFMAGGLSDFGFCAAKSECPISRLSCDTNGATNTSQLVIFTLINHLYKHICTET